MYSQCPDCHTRFRVTAEVLRAARGTVRCGRCGSAFDALERLSDSIPTVTPDPGAVPLLVAEDVGTTSKSGGNVEYHFTADDLERVFIEATDWRDTFPLRPTDPTQAMEAAGGAESTLVVVDEAADVEDITLEGERIRIEELPGGPSVEVDVDSTDELEILTDIPDSAYPNEPVGDRSVEGVAATANEPDGMRVDDAVADAAAPVDAAIAEALERLATGEPAAAGDAVGLTAAGTTAGLDPGAAPATPAMPHAATRATTTEATPWPAPSPATTHTPLAAQRWRRPVEEEVEDAAATDDDEPRGSGWAALGWTLAGLLLALALAAQLIHHYRQDLVRHPQLGPSLRLAYERLGLGLLPNWDLEAFELRQWGNAAPADAAGGMTVRASLTNRAAFAQPHPILRLELEDRYGATVATRDFEPADYLANPAAAGRLLAAGASSDAELLLADPGPEAVGYRLDVCLRESEALLRCASGPG
jgi:predicted Zn finger-like uncharacterized protein